MADQPVNLRQWKKRRARDQKRAEADANAVRHGRTGGEKARDRLERNRAERHLDGHAIDDE